jgi:hypothetical protein
MIRVTAYFSSAIRGKEGDGVSQETIDKNIEAAKEMGVKIRAYFGELLDMYVPHDQDDVIQILWRGGKVTATDVLDADVKVLLAKDLLFVWEGEGGFVSGGMRREIDEAEKAGKPILRFRHFDERTAQKMLGLIHCAYTMKSFKKG